MDMALRGFFVRGAISVGDVYIDDIAVFGPAHLNAYEAEQKQAITPRVILANSAVEAACEYQATYPESESNPLSQRVRLDSDDLRFVNYLDFASHDVTLITQHRDIVSTKYQEHEADLRIQSKYCWVAKYHNNFCAEHSEKFGQLNIPFL